MQPSRRCGLERFQQQHERRGTGVTALHDVVDYWALKVFRDTVTMTPDDKSKPVVKPVMTHFFYMDEKDPSKVRWWVGSVGPIRF